MLHQRLIGVLAAVGLGPLMHVGAAMGADDTGSEASTQIEEIVVTAQKRAEPISKTPLAISAITAADLKDLNVRSSFDLSAVSPFVNTDSSGYGVGAPRFYIRGVGDFDFSPNATQSVGVYLDDVYLESNLAAGFLLLDLNRVEVLRGPQGTLFGKNATAGVLSFESERPSKETKGYADLTIGQYGERDIDAAWGGELIPGELMVRASIATNRDDGYSYNRYLGRRIGDHVTDVGRLSFLWTPTDSLDVLVSYLAGSLDQTIAYRHVGLQAGGVDANGVGQSPDPFVLDIGDNPTGSIRSDLTTAHLTWRLGGGYELIDIAGLARTRSENKTPDDPSPNPVELSDLSANTSQVSNELRLQSPRDEFLTFIAGLYYLSSHVSGEYTTVFPPFASFSNDDRSTVDSSSYAGFVSGTFNFTKDLTLTVGGRYNDEQKHDHLIASNFTPNNIDQFNVGIASALTPYASQDAGLRSRIPTWDVTGRWEYVEDSSVYARIAHGFRAGNFNTVVFTPQDISTVKPETLTSYELGHKGEYFDRHLRSAVDFFYSDYRNLQVATEVGAGQQIANAAAAKIKGVEIEITARPIASWNVSASLSMIDPKYSSFPLAVAPAQLTPGGTGTINLSDQQLDRTSKTTANLSTSYTVPIGSWHLTARTDWNYASFIKYAPWVGAPNLVATAPFVGQLGLIESALSQKAYWKGNLSIKFGSQDDRYWISGWAGNLTNRTIVAEAYPLTFNSEVGQIMAPPRVFGVSIGASFK